MKKFFAILICLFIILGGYLAVKAADKDGTDLHWNNAQTIKVYIPHHPYELTIRHAFEYWDRAIGAQLHFIMVNRPELAQDVVIFVDRLEGNKVGLAEKTYRTKTYSSGKKVSELTGLKIYIALKDPDGENMTKNQIYTIALHEIGHSLGLGHSDDPKSIMYPNAYEYGIMEVTKQDIINLYKLYGWRY